jgi:hypothetical protein
MVLRIELLIQKRWTNLYLKNQKYQY